RSQMFQAAEALDFEKAARLRDEVKRVQGLAAEGGELPATTLFDPYAKSAKKGGVRKSAATKPAFGGSKKPASPASTAKKRTRKPS
ncbi:MAG: hypothetical protein EOP08_16675, partial [Proteobacteria bacterium]